MSAPRAWAFCYRASLLLRRDPKPSKRQQRHLAPIVPQRVYRSAMAFAVLIWCFHWAIHMSCDLPTTKNLKSSRRSLSKVGGHRALRRPPNFAATDLPAPRPPRRATPRHVVTVC